MRYVGAGKEKVGVPIARRECGTCRFWEKTDLYSNNPKAGVYFPCMWATKAHHKPVWLKAARFGSPAFSAGDNHLCPVWEECLPESGQVAEKH